MTISGDLDNFIAYDLFVRAPQDQSEDILSDIQRFLSDISKDHIWSREAIELRVGEPLDGFVHLKGRTEFGDAMDDEWFIVYLIWKLSSERNDIVIRLNDNDGEFLLIECAYHLPDWLSPENDTLRVFVHDGEIHLIPPVVSENPTLESAVAVILDESKLTLAPMTIQETIMSRIGPFQTSSYSCLSAKAIVHRDIARVLLEEPQWISLAIEAFHSRDPLNARYGTSLNRFPPTESVLTTMQITRILYAQAICQKFPPPKSFLQIASLKKLLCEPAKYPKQTKWADLGVKVSVGFEILMSDPMYADDKTDIAQKDTSWNAKRRSPRRYLAAVLERSREKYPTDALFDKEIETLGLWKDDPSEDDSWLHVTSEELEHLLRQRTGKSNSFDLKNVKESMGNFFVAESGFEGVDNQEKTRLDNVIARIQKRIEAINSGEWDSDQWTSDEGEDEREVAEVYDEGMERVMADMDAELASARVRRKMHSQSDNEGEDTEDDDSSVDGEDVDYNLLKNFMESFKAQQGHTGPVETLLGHMGFVPPRDSQ